MKRIFRLLVFVLIFSSSSLVAQDVYLAGTSSQSLMPGDESISLPLAGYAGPWAGRFTLKWVEKGKASENPEVTAGNAGQLPEKLKKAAMAAGLSQLTIYHDTLYGISTDGSIKRAAVKSKKLAWEPFIKLSNATGFVVHEQYVYAGSGSDTLWKTSVNNPSLGWQRAGYYNGLIKKVNIQKLFVHQNKLYVTNEADSLFEAGKNQGKPQEELFARGLAVKKGDNTVLMLCLDLCGVTYGFINEIKGELARKRGIPSSAILFNASHTHFVPGTQAWLTWAPHNRLPDSNYLNKVVRPGIIKAAEDALDNMKPSTIYFGRGATNIGFNRSNRGQETPYDDAVDVIRVVSQNGKDNSLLVLSGCHPVAGTKGSGHYTISSNYPGYVRSILEQTTGHSTKALFMQGCGGDINPRDEPEITGMKLALDVLKVLNTGMKPLTGEITFVLDSLKAPTVPWEKSKIEQFRDENIKLGAGMEPERNVEWAKIMLKNYEQNTMPAEMPVYIHTINIGNWKLVGLSRETVTEYSLAIKKLWPDKMVSVAGYCNDVSSYLPVERHIKTGVYEGYGSYLWYGQPSAFPLNILELVVNHIRSQNY